jgi:hypothetical protein
VLPRASLAGGKALLQALNALSCRWVTSRFQLLRMIVEADAPEEELLIQGAHALEVIKGLHPREPEC